jgi:transposase
MKIATIGIDLAKSVFAVHGGDERGKNALKKTLQREQVAGSVAITRPAMMCEQDERQKRR